MNIIYGTDARDIILGTEKDDYIIAGAGADFWITGGGGQNVFEVNYGDEIVRIADFKVGIDAIALENRDVLEGLTHHQNGADLDIYLFDNTLIRINDVSEKDISTLFTFKPEMSLPQTYKEPGSAEAKASGEYNIIHGTSERDAIHGTSADDYIIAGAGKDFWVAGGAGRDVFEVNYGDDVVRIADFVLGIDSIALESSDVLASATFKQNGERLDVRLSDGTLIRLNGVTEEDAPDIFDFRNDVPATPEPPVSLKELKVVVFGGQSLAFGATGRDWVNTEAQFSNSLMLDFENPQNSARGWETGDVNVDEFKGFTPRLEVAQETPATGAMNVLASAFPETDFVSLHYGKSGESLDFIEDNTMNGLYQQLELLKEHALSQGYELNPTIELVWIQGQSGSGGDYSDQLVAHRQVVEQEVQKIFGQDVGVELYTTITRGFGGKTVTGEQFDAIQEDPNIHLGSTEVVFNALYPARDNVWNAHLTGEGYYMMGSQIGSRIAANMTGEPVAPIAVESVEEIDPTTFHVHFSGVQGALQENPDVYNPSYFIGSPEHFGIDIYKTNNGVADGEIIASRIVDMDTIEFKYDRELSGEFRLWVGRSDSDGWITEDTGAGYGGTTLYDDGYLYSAVLPDSGLTLQTESLFEYVPQQHYDFFV